MTGSETKEAVGFGAARRGAWIVSTGAAFAAATAVGVASAGLWLAGGWTCLVGAAFVGEGHRDQFGIDAIALVLVLHSFVLAPPGFLATGGAGLFGSFLWQLRGGNPFFGIVCSGVWLAMPWLHAAVVLACVGLAAWSGTVR
jgi:hypothetical protein